MGFLRHQLDFKIAPDRLCITSQRRHRRRMAGTAAAGGLVSMRSAIFACVNPARFRALSSSSKSANSGSSASYSALTSGSESAFSLNFSDVSIFGLLQTLPGFC